MIWLWMEIKVNLILFILLVIKWRRNGDCETDYEMSDSSINTEEEDE